LNQWVIKNIEKESFRRKVGVYELDIVISGEILKGVRINWV